ncbi:MAG: leucine-rich repeat protein [Clostridia bacterium]|nr:leucine-rich repeat protein [Clostridia bacterium]MBQ7862814.1 leucine-rich repeat protein [Clostridia bacterium]
MEKIKRMLSILMVVIMLSISLPISAFAEYGTAGAAIEDTIYEIGKTYSVNGVDYCIEESGSVTVKGPALKGVPERVEILSKLGDYTVTSIGYGAFQNCDAIKEVILPETITTLLYLAFKGSGLTYMEIKGKNVNVRTDFKDTPLYENPDNWKNDILMVSGYAVVSKAKGKVILDKDVVGVSEQCFGYSSPVTDLTILNPECHIMNSSAALPLNATIYAYKDSTAQKYAKGFGRKFSLICDCDDTVFVPATKSYCYGVTGYSDGYWCNICNMYSSGGIKDTTFEHTDLDEDNICDFCKLSTDIEISDAGKCGDEVYWRFTDKGDLYISGTGDVYTYNYTINEPWYSHRNEIKKFTAEEGIGRLHGISFADYKNLESVAMADSVLSLPKSFENCTALKDIIFPKSILAIPSDCFRGCTSLESVFIPKNVAEIGNYAFYNCANLSDIDFETGYVKLGFRVFRNTAAYNNSDNIKDGFLYIDNCLIAEITPGVTTLVLGEEVTSIATGWDADGSNVTEIVVYNYDCAFPRDSGAVPYNAVLKGYVGSTAWFYTKNFGLTKRFVALEEHTHTEVIDIPAVTPTEKEPGYTHQSHCSVCGEIVSKREKISPVEYEITVEGNVVIAQKSDAATNENDGADIVITFSVYQNVCTSNVSQTVIYKVGEVKLSKTEFTYNGKVQKPNVTVKDSKGALLVKDRDYKITYSDNSKYSGKYTVDVNYIGNYAGRSTMNYSIVINPITPMTSASTIDSVTLSWVKGHSDLVYRVYSVDGSGNLTKIADTKNDSYKVTSLEGDTEYRFLVRAYVKGDDGKTYWGEKGNVMVCATKSNKGIINWLRNIIAKFKAIIQRLFRITK